MQDDASAKSNCKSNRRSFGSAEVRFAQDDRGVGIQDDKVVGILGRP